MLQFDDGAFGQSTAGCVFDRRSGNSGNIGGALAEECQAFAAEESFRGLVGERQTRAAIEANEGFRYGGEERNGIVRFARLGSTDFRGSLRCTRTAAAGWR